MHHVTREDEDHLLELLNTTPVVHGKVVDELADEAQGRAWLLRRNGRGTAGELKRLIAARDSLQRVVRGETGPDELMQVLRTAVLVPAAGEGTIVWTLESEPEDLFAARSVLAWVGLENSRPGRLRPCANVECRLFLIDRSNGNRAQWCSMAVCGNRMKARRHYERSQTK
ncbi:CGNR zinc finger domain-containing protein [uncultured Arthrobacter sp.]|uniref:CGNR zinc finger domain-containing protein n=1 Tax=uncultured Arthrobacter sp. TaxID=114050 RepID=UPI0025F94F12|nr:CGNR zinc finger domain-containing protein [uncultured Arthrobacter sp.]